MLDDGEGCAGNGQHNYLFGGAESRAWSMNAFRLFAHGREFDVDAFLATTTLRPDHVWHRGDQRRDACVESRHPTSGVEYELGDGRTLTLPEQEKIAIEYLSANQEALRVLAKWPGVTTFILALQYQLELGPGTFGFTIRPSALLMEHALAVGVSPTFYVWLDRRREWAGEYDAERGHSATDARREDEV